MNRNGIKDGPEEVKRTDAQGAEGDAHNPK